MSDKDAGTTSSSDLSPNEPVTESSSELHAGHTAPSELPAGHTVPSELPAGHTAPNELHAGHTAPSELPAGHTAPSELPTGHTVPSELPAGHTAPSELPAGHTAPSELHAGHTAPSELHAGHNAPSKAARPQQKESLSGPLAADGGTLCSEPTGAQLADVTLQGLAAEDSTESGVSHVLSAESGRQESPEEPAETPGPPCEATWPAKPPRCPEDTSPAPPEATLVVPLTSTPAAAAALTPADGMWTSTRDQAVRLRMEDSGPGSETPVTVHQLLLETVEGFGEHGALASKVQGQWVTVTWRQYYQRCRAAAKSFLKLGLERFHGVGILGFNSPEWFISNIGCILAGGLAAGIYTTNSAEACQYVAANCAANVLVVENHKQLLKILQVKDQLPHLKAIVQYKDELQQKLPNLYTWAEFMKLGEEVSEAELDAVIGSLRANECCTLIYTSGTTGNPKGVMLSHDNLTWTATAAGTMSGLEYGEEVVLSYLPLSHVAAQVNDMWLCAKFAATTYFAEPDALKGSLGATLKEVRPTSFLGVPRVWEKIQEKMKAAGAKASPLRMRIAAWAKSIGLQYNYSIMNKDLQVPWGFTVANGLVFKKVRLALGLDRCKNCFTGAAPITKETLEYFMSLNIPLLELYGMSESSGPHALSLSEDYCIMSCGKVMTGCKTKLDKPDEDGNGEVCFWGRHVFMGYLNSADQTEEALDQDGWLHSGDLGKHDANDFLFITGRIKELIITAGGENIPPVPIEDAVKAEAAIVSNAMLLGDKLKFLSMFLTLKCDVDDDGEPTDNLNAEALAYCQRLGVTATTVSEIIANKEPAVYKAIQEAMERVNARSTSNAQKVQKWLILDRDFSVSGGELGPTMKLKRPVVTKMHQEKINELYSIPETTS